MDLFNLLQKTANDRKRHLLILFLGPNDKINDQKVLTIEKLFRGLKDLELDLLIHSGGGSAHSAYQIADLLGSKAKDLTVAIPLYAKSAATLLCLGAKNIVLGEIAQLGPLDTQIEERQRGSTASLSALDPFKALEQLTEFSSTAMDVMVKLILSRAQLGVEDAIKYGIDFSTRISSTLYQQVNAEKLGQYSRALSIGYEYGLRLLIKSGMSDQDANKILNKLIYGYPSHSYIINASELKDLGLPARICGEECYPNMHDISDSILNYFDQTGLSIVQLIKPEIQTNEDRLD